MITTLAPGMPDAGVKALITGGGITWICSSGVTAAGVRPFEAVTSKV